jgi:hypothetical protein
MDTEEEQYEQERKYIEETFPDCNFTIDIPIDELDNVISKEKTIILRHRWYEYYIDTDGNLQSISKRNFYVISSNVMSIKNIIHEMIKQDVKCWGDHRFLESIYPSSKENETQFELWFGS